MGLTFDPRLGFRVRGKCSLMRLALIWNSLRNQREAFAFIFDPCSPRFAFFFPAKNRF